MTLLLASSACVSERVLFTAPDSPTGPGGRSDATNPLVGTWQTTLIIQVAGDLQTWTTTWTFQADGSCRFHQVVRSAVLGTDTVRQRECTWSSATGQIRTTYLDTGSVVSIPYSFPVGQTDRVTLEGIEYRRIG